MHPVLLSGLQAHLQPIVAARERAGGGELPPASEIGKGLTAAREDIFRRYDEGEAAELLIRDMSALIDRVLETCFSHFVPGEPKSVASLVAVGGYGRSELLPGSDIDLMILLQRKPGRERQEHSAIVSRKSRTLRF